VDLAQTTLITHETWIFEKENPHGVTRNERQGENNGLERRDDRGKDILFNIAGNQDDHPVVER